MIQFLRRNAPGILLVLVLGALAWFLAPLISFANSVIVGLLLGLIVGNVYKIGSSLETGVQTSSGKGLELSILFLSFSINYRNIGALGIGSFLIIVVVVFSTLILTSYLAKKMNCPGNSGLLIGFGTAICGSSAIAALSPQLKGSKEDTGMAIAVVNLLGSGMMLLFPLILPLFALSQAEQGIILGGSLHAVGNVAGAGYAMGPEIGEAAITIKLARIALLSPALIFMHLLLRDKTPGTPAVAFRLPWYLIAFILITIVNSLVPFPEPFIRGMKITGEVLLTLAMVAIGLKVRILSLLKSGKRGLAFGVVIFVLMTLLLVGLMELIL